MDSKGDVYVASAGESKIRIFNSAHAELASISNSDEPCGIAVNGNGELFVSEEAIGQVVRYKPNAYPLVGVPTYGAAESIDESGLTKGVFIDPTDNRLYIAEGNRIAAYNADGSLGIDEEQRIGTFEATGGTFKLSFDGEETGSIAWDATNAEIKTALFGLTTIGIGNVSVVEGPLGVNDHRVTFEGALANTNVELLKANTGELVGNLNIATLTNGFSGHIGEGTLAEATGVAAFTSAGGDRYVFAADPAGVEADRISIFSGSDVRTLKLRKTIIGSTPGNDFGFGPEGAYLSVDPGNRSAENKCASIAEQACTAGHFFVYDGAHEAVDEFDAVGGFVDQIASPEFADAAPAAIAIDRSGSASDGVIYVSTGPSSGSKLLAFGPLVTPSREVQPELSRELKNARAVATDTYGDVYVAAGAVVLVFGPDGKALTEFEDTHVPLEDLAVDSTGRVYVLENETQVTYYTPSAYPPTSGAVYSRHEPTVTSSPDFPINNKTLKAIAVNQANDHVLVTSFFVTHELASAASGSTLLNGDFAGDLNLGSRQSIAVNSASGEVYVGAGGSGFVRKVNKEGAEILAQINGAGSPQGLLPPNPITAVDQANGHVVTFAPEDPAHAIREYEASGSFVGEVGEIGKIGSGYRLAIDSACALHDPPLTESTTPTCGEFDPANGTIYLAFDDQAPGNPFDLAAFGPLSYGEGPLAFTDLASELGSGGATLSGAVNPNGFDLSQCEFQYLTEDEYETAGETFTGAEEAGCVPGPSEIGHGADPIPVHADITGLDSGGRYRFRLVAANKYGESSGEAGLFGPPVLITQGALPVLFEEATLRANIDPSGLPTTYRFEYGTAEDEYGHSTPSEEVSSSAGPTDVKAALTGLEEGTSYHFRIVVENEAKTVPGPDQTFVTQRRRAEESCSNAAYRTGLSAKLPDCRAYELVTPAETNGLSPYAADTGSAGAGFNDWLTTPRGLGAGQSLAYFTDGTLPGFDGTGIFDSYRAQRGEGAHPKGGWTSEIFNPSFLESAPTLSRHPSHQGVSSDQLYSFWRLQPEEPLEGTLPTGIYLRTPGTSSECPGSHGHFELVGCGILGTDPGAESHFVSANGAHVVFSSKAHLEEGAAPQGTIAVYDRTASQKDAQVVSQGPGNTAFAAGENATYVASSEDGSAIAFRVGGTLYLHQEGQSSEIAEAPNTFAGLSEDGDRIFYAASASGSSPSTLYACNVQAGPCAGPGAQPPAQIAVSSTFINVSGDGSHVFYGSEEALTGTEENENRETAKANQRNLYAWNAETGITHFIAVLDSRDFESFGGVLFMNLDAWTRVINAGAGIGRANSPTRSTPDGEVFLFQSHAQLSAYDNEGIGEIYRYEPSAEAGEQLLCLSCNPSKAPPSADALLQDVESIGAGNKETLIPNVTDGGGAAFFQSPDRLLPDDANDVEDVYEWQTNGGGDCEREGGCLALISSGQGETPSTLFSMSADGHDVFFGTKEMLLGVDVAGSPSLYDAREEGGIPGSPILEGCQGDACQGNGSTPPVLSTPAGASPNDGNVPPRTNSGCKRGKHRVKGRCIAKKHRKHRRTSHKRRAHR